MHRNQFFSKLSESKNEIEQHDLKLALSVLENKTEDPKIQKAFAFADSHCKPYETSLSSFGFVFYRNYCAILIFEALQSFAECKNEMIQNPEQLFACFKSTRWAHQLDQELVTMMFAIATFETDKTKRNLTLENYIKLILWLGDPDLSAKEAIPMPLIVRAINEFLNSKKLESRSFAERFRPWHIPSEKNKKATICLSLSPMPLESESDKIFPFYTRNIFTVLNAVRLTNFEYIYDANKNYFVPAENKLTHGELRRGSEKQILYQTLQFTVLNLSFMLTGKWTYPKKHVPEKGLPYTVLAAAISAISETYPETDQEAAINEFLSSQKIPDVFPIKKAEMVRRL